LVPDTCRIISGARLNKRSGVAGSVGLKSTASEKRTLALA
jgi:hypothetical protein